MQLHIEPAPLKASDVPALIQLCSAPEVGELAARTVATLRQIVNVLALDPGALTRRAATVNGGVEWLRDLATSAQSAHQLLLVERDSARQVLDHWRSAVHRFDSAAMRLFGEARDKLAGARALAAQHRLSIAELRQRLADSGLTAEEIDAVVQQREGPEGSLSQAQKADAQADAAAAECAAIEAFLSDPLRRLESLPPPVAAALVELTDALSELAAGRAAVQGSEALATEGADVD